MLTIALTNRNKPYTTLQRCIRSLSVQGALVVLVDYGSDEHGLEAVQKIQSEFPEITIHYCPTQARLWNKSRALNIILKQCDTPYFFVGDVDMIFHPDFVEQALHLAKEDQVMYFQAGFLSKEESQKEKEFKDYHIDFPSTSHATGMTLYPTHLLKALNGYDEFYHGWGSEDTDVHVRMKNAGVAVHFYDKEILMLHQWHPKHYRSVDSLEPFHSYQERVNQAYLKQATATHRTLANANTAWGVVPKELPATPSQEMTAAATRNEIDALLASIAQSSAAVVKLTVVPHSQRNDIKQTVKKMLGKKTPLFIDMQEANDRILEWLIVNHREKDYSYVFDRKKDRIEVVLRLQ